ncbi:MAG TPA: hypothetical protein VGH91_04415 [Gammaproteobacteria bacterium]|jgi:hypothetical protein
MHRQLVYPGQIPLETDVLSTNKDAYQAIAKLAQALFGSNTVVNGLTASATGPASLAVLIQPGEIYSVQTMDTSAYSTLGTDAATILKQGIITTTSTLSTPAPGTAGQSINYLVEVGFVESDANAVVLPYYNASNPSVAWSGPANSGSAQFTQRQDLAQVQVKAGTAAATGTQVTPTPDAGFVGLWVVTVANGQGTVTAGNITAYAGAPFLHGPSNNPLFPVSNYVATVDPGVSNDNTQGYVIGSNWLNTSTNTMFVCVSAGTGAAVWKADTSAPSPNFFVDPSCRVAQGATASLSLTKQYGSVDMVQAWVSGAGAAVSAGTIGQDTAGTAGGITPYSVSVTGVTTTGAAAAMNFRRWIESRDSLPMVGQTCTFSAIIEHNVGSTLAGCTITLNKANAQDNFAGGTTLIATSPTFSVASGASTVVSFTTAMGACGNGVEMVINLPCGAITTKNFYATDFRGAVGSSVQVFALPKFNDDYVNVMRYFEKSYEYATVPGTAIGNRPTNGGISFGNGGTWNSATIFSLFSWAYKVPKLAAPTVKLFSQNSGAANKVYDLTQNADETITPNSYQDGFAVTNGTGGALTAGDVFMLQFTADARL